MDGLYYNFLVIILIAEDQIPSLIETANAIMPAARQGQIGGLPGQIGALRLAMQGEIDDMKQPLIGSEPMQSPANQFAPINSRYAPPMRETKPPNKSINNASPTLNTTASLVPVRGNQFAPIVTPSAPSETAT